MPVLKNPVDPGTVAILGMPFDDHSSFLKGAAKAPAAIRKALQSPSSNLTAESGFSLDQTDKWLDAGDLLCLDPKADFDSLEETVNDLLSHGCRVLTLGGDHSISYPILKAFARHHSTLTVLQLDAHPDLYDSLDGNRLSHACPFARIMENRLAARLVQVGIRTVNEHQQKQGERFNVEMHTMNSWKPDTDLKLSGPLYISFDLDCLDPAFAPGVSHHEPGGLSTREVLNLLQAIKVPVVGADLVEYNPDRDLHGMTATVAAKLVKELTGLMTRK